MSLSTTIIDAATQAKRPKIALPQSKSLEVQGSKIVAVNMQRHDVTSNYLDGLIYVFLLQHRHSTTIIILSRRWRTALNPFLLKILLLSPSAAVSVKLYSYLYAEILYKFLLLL